MPEISSDRPVAFFCAEFGIDSHIPIYAGGLGVLAGDILKEAADQKLPYVGIGLLYRGVGSIQRITNEGKQVEENFSYDPEYSGLTPVFIDEMPVFIKVHMTELNIWVRCWQKKIGETVTLYLLDPDTEQNPPAQRSIAHALYAGTEEDIIKQQLLLGIGGVKLLHTLGIHPSLYHVNEGRPSFLHWQLIRSHMVTHNLSYLDAANVATQKTIYTNHTLVEAGNQVYTNGLLKKYGEYYAQQMGISIDDLLRPGISQTTNQFSVTEYALNTSRKASAVSQLHFEFCKKRWPNHNWVGITNGVHMPSWQANDLAVVSGNQLELWKRHIQHKREVMEYVRQRTGYGYDPERLVITWARRVAGYKRMSALFEDVIRLKKIISESGREVQILIAGKAHIYDPGAKSEIEKVIHAMQHELSGYALFIPNLDIELDAQLTRGSDIWLNTPEIGYEASGTSGMKALSNGVLQCTVADGWAHEVDWSDLGWVLDSDHVSESIYYHLEKSIIPEYYYRNESRIPEKWMNRMQKSIALSSYFSAKRMMKEYQDLLYSE